MERYKTITYAIDTDTGLTISRFGNELAWPILDFEGMTPVNNFQTNYNLEKMPVFQVGPNSWSALRWTKKIPVEIKNIHRQFWGMKPLREATHA